MTFREEKGEVEGLASELVGAVDEQSCSMQHSGAGRRAVALEDGWWGWWMSTGA